VLPLVSDQSAGQRHPACFVFGISVSAGGPGLLSLVKPNRGGPRAPVSTVSSSDRTLLFLAAAAVDLDFLYFALSLRVYAPFLSRGKQ